MSHPKKAPQSPTRPRTGVDSGLPLSKGLVIVLAALATGVVFSSLFGSVGWPFILCFAAGALAAAIFTRVRGLFIVVASLPIFFLIAVVIAGWLNTRADLPEGASPWSKTSLLTSVFPALAQFPALALVTLGALAIAVLRVWRAKNLASSSYRAQRQRRRQDAAADKRNRNVTARARQRARGNSQQPADRLSVAELMARDQRAKAEKNSGRPAHRDSHRSVRQRERDRELRRRDQQQALRPDNFRRAGDLPASRLNPPAEERRAPRRLPADHKPQRDAKPLRAQSRDEDLYGG